MLCKILAFLVVKINLPVKVIGVQKTITVGHQVKKLVEGLCTLKCIYIKSRFQLVNIEKIIFSLLDRSSAIALYYKRYAPDDHKKTPKPFLKRNESIIFTIKRKSSWVGN